MATRMLIDARHPEETRVAVLTGNRIEEFDFESAEHKQIKGNIYLAKVTRVEPSLQAAFVDFGGNRHGFLAFSEIHPDYYQIPQSDREALLAEEQAHAEEEAALRAADDEDGDHHEGPDDFDGHDLGDDLHDHDDDGHEEDDDEHDEDGRGGVEEIDTGETDEVATIEDGFVEDSPAEDADGEAADEHPRGTRGRGRRQGRSGGARAKEVDELRAKRQALRRRYKIQDVIQRRQVLLVQVVKEERGNKGAALTTYLSLAGRYCVLMPNSSHGGGISRKISSVGDRKRLKSIVGELTLPRSMGLIVRTAGLQRTKTEIKRDFDYLARVWDEIRERTLSSSAPALIHSDSDLIKRAIRDIYNREIEEVVVEGDDGYRSARAFMKLLMPSHVRRVKQYADPVPLYQRYGAEDQLSAMYDPVVQLKSGGYLVINPTEALVSIDINSGRSTKEHGIEATALNTNLEAAREIARQLRLRDMAGLVVIDFIDMEYSSNVRKVEKAMKDALRNDRARIQVGRISGFGLMEMSRQRLRTGVLEATTRSCPHCDGTGLVRTASSAGLSALRLIEDEAAKGKGTTISLFASTEAAVYLLNAKRADLHEIEERYAVTVEVLPEGEDEGAKMRVGSTGPRPTSVPKFEPIADEVEDDDGPEDEAEDEEAEVREPRREREGRGERGARDADGEGSGKRRRRRRGGRGRERDEADVVPSRANDDEVEGEAAGDDREDRDERSRDDEAPLDGERPKKRRRRGGRRRRRHGEEGGEGENQPATAGFEGAELGEDIAAEAADTEAAGEAVEGEPVADTPKPRSRRRKAVVEAPETVAEESPAAVEAPPEDAPAPKARSRRKAAPAAEPVTEDAPSAEPAPAEAEQAPAKAKRPRKKPAPSDAEGAKRETIAANDADGGDEDGPRRGGWWQRTFGP
ncbi:MAG: Rne/Rng family ribonuclease [Croceibacterium sp.]